MMAVRKQYQVNINHTLCKKCGICYWICPTKTITKGELGRPQIIDQKTCIGCLMCENACPDLAIDVHELEAVKEDA